MRTLLLSALFLDFIFSLQTSDRAGTAFQFMATILISITLAVVAVSAFTPASTAKKLGRAAGMSLLLFSFLQMIAFAVMDTFARERERQESACLLHTSKLKAKMGSFFFFFEVW